MRVVAPSGNPDDTGGCEIIVAVVPCQFKPNSTNLRSAHLTRDPAAAAFWPSCSTTKSASCQSRVPGEPAFWPDRRIIFSRLAVCLCRLGAWRDKHKQKFSVTACWTVCCECERWKEEPKR